MPAFLILYRHSQYDCDKPSTVFGLSNNILAFSSTIPASAGRSWQACYNCGTSNTIPTFQILYGPTTFLTCRHYTKIHKYHTKCHRYCTKFHRYYTKIPSTIPRFTDIIPSFTDTIPSFTVLYQASHIQHQDSQYYIKFHRYYIKIPSTIPSFTNTIPRFPVLYQDSKIPSTIPRFTVLY